MTFLKRIRGAFQAKAEAPEARPRAEENPEDRLQVLVGRQKAITRGRGSAHGSEGLVRDAI
ncbi:MAG: hypothetical protein E6G94_01670 [Alphaproteobacteria bacterium]|nr:MAG: hypothetical protein E6G94_01670 [Alphaproteobacteria bacterium]